MKPHNLIHFNAHHIAVNIYIKLGPCKRSLSSCIVAKRIFFPSTNVQKSETFRVSLLNDAIFMILYTIWVEIISKWVFCLLVLLSFFVHKYLMWMADKWKKNAPSERILLHYLLPSFLCLLLQKVVCHFQGRVKKEWENSFE